MSVAQSSSSGSPPTLSASPAPVSPASSQGIVSNQHQLNNNLSNDPSTGPIRRKTSRRANTAERRATHNAVERQRRETLNSRFLDLAALLPNLAAVRRPSKSAIVNSSIALIHTQRRARSLAARELRVLKAETDDIRNELNQWRDRAGLQRIGEPERNTEFVALMQLEEASAAEEEEIRRAYEMASIPLGDEDEDGYVDVPQYADAPPQPVAHMVPQSAPAHMTSHHHAPPPQQQQQMQPPVMHHELQHQLQAALMQSRPQVHIPAFDGPSMFPGPGHHQAHQHQHIHQQPTPVSAHPNAFGQSFGPNGSPPQSSHGFQPYPAPQPRLSGQFSRDAAQQQQQQSPFTSRSEGQFAHMPPPMHRDDDSASSSSGGGSPPATGHSHLSQHAGFNMGMSGMDVPTLAAGATQADFARYWAQPQLQQQGGPGNGKPMVGFTPQALGFAM